jgi:hypothetical protein
VGILENRIFCLGSLNQFLSSYITIGFSTETEPIDIEIDEEIYYDSEFTWLCSLRSPTTYHLLAGEPRNQMMKLPVQSPKL